MNFITSPRLPKPQIETLLQVGEIQLELFDQVLAEVQASDGIRYVLRLAVGGGMIGGNLER